MLTRVMAAEWGPFNIQTNAVAPTVVLTDMGKRAWSDEEKSAPVKARIPLHRFGLPLEIADLVSVPGVARLGLHLRSGRLIDGGYSEVSETHHMAIAGPKLERPTKLVNLLEVGLTTKPDAPALVSLERIWSCARARPGRHAARPPLPSPSASRPATASPR